MPDATTPDAALPDLPGDEVRRIVEEQYAQHINDVLGEVPRPINWRTLPPDDLEHELLEVNAWVDWLRHEYRLPAQIIPPMWHRHPELLWELSALRQHWLFSYDPQAKGNQALAWHHDFGLARERLREWVATCGTRLDRDRPTRQTTWPGEVAQAPIEDEVIPDRDADFITFVSADAARRAQIEEETIAAAVAAAKGSKSQ